MLKITLPLQNIEILLNLMDHKSDLKLIYEKIMKYSFRRFLGIFYTVFLLHSPQCDNTIYYVSDFHRHKCNPSLEGYNTYKCKLELVYIVVP
jgi:hypothetical protein